MKRIVRLLPVVILLCLSIVTHWSWFLKLGVLSWGDWDFFDVKMLADYFNPPLVWWSRSGFDAVNSLLTFAPIHILWGSLAMIGVGYPISERLLFAWPIALLAPITSFFLAKKLTGSTLSSFFAALVYSFNIYFLSLQADHWVLAVAYVLAPWAFLCLMNFLEKKTIPSLIALIISCYLMAAFEFRIFYIESILLILYVLFYFFILKKVKDLKKFFALGITGLVVFLALNAYWLVFTLFNGLSGFTFLFRGLFGSEFYSLQEAFTLFYPFWSGKEPQPFIVNPISWNQWIFPIISFLGVIYAKKDKRVLYFAFISLLGIILTKQIDQPLTGLYPWLFSHFPGFIAFREASKFYQITAIGYSILTAYAIFVAKDILSKIRYKKFRLFSFCFILSVVAGLILVNTIPLINLSIESDFINRVVNSDYTKLENFLLQSKAYSRLMGFPEDPRYVFYNMDHPKISFIQEIQSANFSPTPDPKLLSLLNVKYLFLPSDSLGEEDNVYQFFGKKRVFQQVVDTTPGWKKVTIGLQHTSLYENTYPVMPHFYISTNNVLLQGDANQWYKVLQIPDTNFSAVLSTIPQASQQDNIFLRLTQNRSNIVNNTQEQMPDNLSTFITTSCIKCTDIGKPDTSLIFPFVKFLPGDILYGYGLRKEQKQIDQAPSSAEKLEWISFYALKRMEEVKKIIDEKKETSRLLTSLDGLSEKLQTTSVVISSIENGHGENNDLLLKSYEYLQLTYSDYSDLTKNNVPFNLSKQVDLLTKDISMLENKLVVSTADKYAYLFSIPDAATYDLYVEAPQENTYTITDGVNTLVNAYQSSTGSIEKVKSISFPNGGGNKLYVQKLTSDNLLPVESRDFSIDSTGLTVTKSVKINYRFKVGNTYTIAFDYSLPQNVPSRFVARSNSDRDYDQNFGALVSEHLDSTGESSSNNTFAHFSTTFTSQLGTTSLALEFILQPFNSGASQMEVKNLSIEDTIPPQLFVLKTSSPSAQVDETPHMDFVKTSPWSYSILVHNAKKPFYLVFTDGFSAGWQAYIKRSISNQPFTNVVQEYPEENVKEYSSVPTSWHSISDLFKTHGEKLTTQLVANKVSNAWYIPYTGDSEITVIFTPEKYAIIGGLISIVTGLLVVMALIYFALLRRKRYEKKP